MFVCESNEGTESQLRRESGRAPRLLAFFGVGLFLDLSAREHTRDTTLAPSRASRASRACVGSARSFSLESEFSLVPTLGDRCLVVSFSFLRERKPLYVLWTCAGEREAREQRGPWKVCVNVCG